MSKPRASRAAKAAKAPIKELPPRKTSLIRGGGTVSDAMKSIGDALQQAARKQ